jgi:hypothetical protein
MDLRERRFKDKSSKSVDPEPLFRNIEIRAKTRTIDDESFWMKNGTLRAL